MIKRIIISAALLMIMTVGVLADAYNNAFPANAPFLGGSYFELSTTQLGRALAFIPDDYNEGFISLNPAGIIPVNVSNTTITGQVYYGTNFTSSYQFRLTRFNTPEYYYQQGSTNEWRTLTVTAIYNTNVNFLDNTSRFGRPAGVEYTNIILIALCVCVVAGTSLLMFKRGNI